MAASKKERLDELYRRLRHKHPFASLSDARGALEIVMREVENELTDIPEAVDPVTALTDGRMYPPHDDFLVKTSSSDVLCFKHRARTLTFIAVNGAIRIASSENVSLVDLKGRDGRTVDDILAGDNE